MIATSMFLVVLILVFWLFLSGVVLIYVAMWKMFVKAGCEGWEGIIPYYNIYKIIEIIGRPSWWFAPFILPAFFFGFNNVTRGFASLSLGSSVQWVITVIALFLFALSVIAWIPLGFGLAKVFGKDRLFGLGVAFLPYVFIPILGFGKAAYLGPRTPPEVPAHP